MLYFYKVVIVPDRSVLTSPAYRAAEKISGNTVVPISRLYVRARKGHSNLFKGYTYRCGDFAMEQKLKQRICIEFCGKLQISATETFEMPNKEFPNDPPKRTTVFERHSRFKTGRISIEDDPRQGRPKFQRTDENLEHDTGISKTTIGRIVTKDLKIKKAPAKFIPRFFTNEQKLCRLATCENMLEMTRTGPEWKDKIITGDETWVYDYDPETKRQYAEWRGQEILPQPPYSPDIAPYYFFLFPKLKAILKGRHFDTRDDIIEKSLLALKSIPKEPYKNCFNNLEKRWR
ncbi:hypothetical protein LAZ67_2004246 [Cordylochernes scorpioides]|uniref:Transposase n=1 Tax=Cordylochernes scorpioides TaxID=51811 RepID=A0ABY6K4I7_9ARAC|nr:hypothetical protein LAZ67_2004246 [Cordylochernes scorpioides]